MGSFKDSPFTLIKASENCIVLGGKTMATIRENVNLITQYLIRKSGTQIKTQNRSDPAVDSLLDIY